MTHVLIADDDIDIRQTILVILEEAGYLVGQAQDGNDTLRQLYASPETFIVLLDATMPRRDGIEVLQVVEADPSLARHRYILLTGRNLLLTPELARLKASLNIPLLTKPFELNDLLELVAQTAQSIPQA
jgi:CheY-like chemotaxis protein